jgi:hypothetical protein
MKEWCAVIEWKENEMREMNSFKVKVSCKKSENDCRNETVKEVIGVRQKREAFIVAD